MFQAHKSIYKQYIKKSLQKIAIDLRLLRQRNYRTIESLLGCDLIIDIGANFGQYANDRFLDGYEGEIISIEPLSYPHSKLLTASLQRTNWKVAKVWRGISSECLSNIAAFQIEVPIAQMYENQTSFDYYYDIMREWGFNFYDAHDGVRSNNGANKVMDIVFIKSDSILFN